ncbi:hypothetical protein CAEBREN_12547 [Caenorhabditis brenneri]|uniref:DNA-directed DNA polymerase n=1 Tax=Caenorhabditis brenneri TaxID=135651 RepID=G0N1A4_CAEBE|nr:hypothetical protein CAEBREN_12547 [Caenorhabditis brenneri]
MVATFDDDSFDNFVPDSRNIPSHSTPLPGDSSNLSFAEAQRPSSSILSLGKPLKLTIELYHRPTKFASESFAGPNFSVTTNWATGVQNTSNIVISDNDYKPGKITIEFDEHEMDEDPKSVAEKDSDMDEEKDSDMDEEKDSDMDEEKDCDMDEEKDSDMEVDSDDNEEDDDEEEEEEESDSGNSTETSEDSQHSASKEDSESGNLTDKAESENEASEDSNCVIQYGAGPPIPPPELEEFVPNMNFPSDEEIEYLHRFVVFHDATSERINDRLVQTKNNGIRLCKLDQIKEMSIEQHVEKIFDIFIRWMIQQVKGSLESTIYWIRLRHYGEKTEEFHVNHRTYAKGNGHVLLNSLSLHMQSEKGIRLDERLDFSMFIFKDSLDTTGRGGHTLSDRIKRVLRLNRQYVQTDGYCLPVSIVLGKAKSDTQNPRKTPDEQKEAQALFRRLTDRRTRALETKHQYEEAKKLLTSVGIDVNQSTHDLEDLKKLARHLSDYQIVVWHFDSHHQNIVVRDHFNEGASGFIGMYFENNHYEYFVPHTGKDSLRTTYCHKCCKLIHHTSRKNNHIQKCTAMCHKCGWDSCDRDGIIKVCPECDVTFFSESCYKLHLEKRSPLALPHCKKYRYCKQCCKSVRRVEYCGVEHECGKYYCAVCRKPQSKNHECCHAVPDKKEREKALARQEKWRFFIYDFETITNKSSSLPTCPDESCHIPNLAVGKFICNLCWKDDDEFSCASCGLSIVFSYKTESVAGPVIKQFLHFLQNDPRLKDAILLAHNGGKYDHSFILSELAKSAGVTPNLLLNGNKIIQSDVQIPNIGKMYFKDTLNFMPMALAQMPSAFGLDESLKKGTFPYLYNHPDHYGSKRKGLPDMEYYQPNFMTPEAKKKFTDWYDENKDAVFDFDKEFLDYCKDDVKILVKSVKKYLKVCSDLFNGWNPIVQCATMASFVMFVMKFEHFKPGVVGYIPENGFPTRNNSKLALKYLQYLDNEDPSLKLEHALNKGEKRIFYGKSSYYVDGFSEATNTVYEVYGCMYHGCRECFKARSMRSPCNPNSTFEDLYQQTILRQSHIENAGFKVEAKWECEINKELDSNKKMKQFFIECRHTSQLNPRDSMYGGRTQPFQAFAKADSMHTIQYFDFCSLYPYTNMIGAEYPKGQPRVIRTDFVPIVAGALVPYHGLIFCDILPPKDLGIPVLPYKTRSKLLFPLCRTCAERPSGGVCTHNEENQRYLTGTWVSEEINLAIKMGYKILKYHEVWHWSTWFTGGFFKSFLQPLLKIKHEASGWPSEVTTDVEKQKHIDTIYENDGVLLDADKVKKNPALRQMSKLFLNSAWGKFAQNPQKVDMQLMDVEDGSAVFNFLNSSLHEPTCLEQWGDHHLLVARKPLKESVKTPRFCNVVYGSITTALARIRLYHAMHRIGAKNLIYCDTDSVMFRQPVGVDLLGNLCGDGLGKLTNEVKQGMRITEVVTIAPKVYAYCLEDENGHLSYEIKAKGMTLNCATRDNVTFDSMKNMMLKHVKKQQYTPLQGQKVSLTRGIKRPLDAPHSKLVVKRMKPIADKGHVLDDGAIIPYGYSTDKTPIIKNYPF